MLKGPFKVHATLVLTRPCLLQMDGWYLFLFCSLTQPAIQAMRSCLQAAARLSPFVTFFSICPLKPQDRVCK